MVISRSPAAPQSMGGQLRFEGVRLPLQNNIKVLVATIDRELQFDQHVTTVVRQTSQRVSALRRVADSFDSRGIMNLYRVHIRLCMDYGAFVWIFGAATHTRRLEVVQRCCTNLTSPTCNFRHNLSIGRRNRHWQETNVWRCSSSTRQHQRTYKVRT